MCALLRARCRLFTARWCRTPRRWKSCAARGCWRSRGIGSPDKFFATLTESGIEVVERHPFPDHHRYTAAEAKTLLTRAQKAGLTLITTEKDQVRLREPGLKALAAKTRVLPVRLAVTEQDAFRDWVLAVTATADVTTATA